MQLGMSETPAFTGTCKMEMVTDEIGNFAKKHEERHLHHIDVEAIHLFENSEQVRRLKRKKNPFWVGVAIINL